MKFARRDVLKFAAVSGAAAAVPRTVWAQNYPTRSIKMIIPFAAGGPTDIIARLVAVKLTERWGQQVVSENMAGVSGNTGTRFVARASPDGYTMLLTASGFVVNPSLYATVPYDPINDFVPVTVPAWAPNVLCVHPSLPVKSVKELVELIKANPGKHSFASPGTGQTSHLAGEFLKVKYGLDLVHVPFNGGGPVMNSMMGGHTLIAFTSMPSAGPYIKDGRIRALAVTTAKRSSAFPEVMTMAEAGFPEQETVFFQGILAPAALRAELRARAEHARAVRRSHQRRGRQVGQGHRRCENHEGGVRPDGHERPLVRHARSRPHQRACRAVLLLSTRATRRRCHQG
jgi:tripartite-type tricarboxylate transporter receptor subunit TctC